jgi:hypothetical protein
MAASIFNFFIVNVRCNDLHYTPVSEDSFRKFSAGFPAHRGNTSTVIRRRNEALPENKKEK